MFIVDLLCNPYGSYVITMDLFPEYHFEFCYKIIMNNIILPLF